MKPVGLADAEAQLRACWAAGDAVGAVQWERWVHAHDPALGAPQATLRGAALWYAEQGLHVFPLQPLCKEPYARSRGCKDATTDRQQVDQWWAAAPRSNIGLATGYGVDVVDVDGPAGNASLARARGLLGDAFPTPRMGHVSTPRPGGRHYYVPAHPEGGGNGAGWLPGLDYRGRGGYVVAPPSVLDDRPGQHPGTYRWLTPLAL